MTFVAICATRPPAPECLAALPDAHVFVDEVLSVARNAALEACDEEWIAYVDGDVVVAEGWRVPRRSTTTWRSSADRSTASSPRTTRDAATFHGGNVALARAGAARRRRVLARARASLRARLVLRGALRPARAEARPAGGRSSTRRMAARRLPSRGRLRRAARTGARRQLVGERRGRGELLRLAARGRPGHVAEALGGLFVTGAGGARPRTRWRRARRSGPSVPIPVRAPALRTAPAASCSSTTASSSATTRWASASSPAHFAAQLDVLRADWEVVALEDATPARHGRDHLRRRLPRQPRRRASSSTACPRRCSSPRATSRSSAASGGSRCARRSPEREGPLRLRDRAWPRRSEIERRYLSAWLQGMAPEEQLQVLAELGVRDDPQDRAMTIDELRGVAGRLGDRRAHAQPPEPRDAPARAPARGARALEGRPRGLARRPGRPRAPTRSASPARTSTRRPSARRAPFRHRLPERRRARSRRRPTRC